METKIYKYIYTNNKSGVAKARALAGDRDAVALALVATWGVLDALSTWFGVVATWGTAVESNPILSRAMTVSLRVGLDTLPTSIGPEATVAIATGPVLLGKVLVVALVALALRRGWRHVNAVPGSSGFLLALLASGVAVPLSNVLVVLDVL